MYTLVDDNLLYILSYLSCNESVKLNNVCKIFNKSFNNHEIIRFKDLNQCTIHGDLDMVEIINTFNRLEYNRSNIHFKNSRILQKSKKYIRKYFFDIKCECCNGVGVILCNIDQNVNAIFNNMSIDK